MQHDVYLFLHRGRWIVDYGSRADIDLSLGVTSALSRLSEDQQKVSAGWLQKFLRFSTRHDEEFGEFISEGVYTGRARIDAFLHCEGFEIVESDRDDQAVWVHQGCGRGFGQISMNLKTLDLLFSFLAHRKLRPNPLPTKTDGWDRLSLGARQDLRTAIFGSSYIGRNYAGRHYVASCVDKYPIRIEDPRGLYPRMAAAAAADNWPLCARINLALMGDAGARYCDVSPTTWLDYWKGSKFGHVIECPLKGSRGERRGTLVFSEPTREMIIRGLPGNDRVPSFDRIQLIVEKGQWDLLDSLYLAPSQLQLPLSYHTFNNTYLRPTMERHDVRIKSRCGMIDSLATGHRLRAASIQSGIEEILEQGLPEKEEDYRLDALREDHHLSSETAFARYCGEILQDFAKARKVERFRQRRESLYDTTTRNRDATINRPLTAFEQRLRAYR